MPTCAWARAAEARPLYERALAADQAIPSSSGRSYKKLADLALAPDRGLAAKAALAEARRYYDELLRLDPHDDDARRSGPRRWRRTGSRAKPPPSGARSPSG